MKNEQSTAQKNHKGEGHRKRLRERFLESGLTGFQDYEIIELLLTLGTPRKDCKDTAKRALKTFKTLPGVLEASPEALLTVKGIGPVNMLGIRLIKETSERYLQQKVQAKDAIHSKKDLIDYLNLTIRDKTKEYFMVIYLNAKNRIMGTDTASTGSLTSSAVYPREIVSAALANNAAALIFAHNHPSGDPTPSSDDITITKKLFSACQLMGMAVHDHVIIAEQGHYSFAEKGLMDKIRYD